MAIKTNLTSLTPRRQAYSREIKLLSNGFSNPKAWPEGKLTVFPWDSQIDEVVLKAGRTADANELMYAVLGKVCDLNGASVDDFVISEVETVLLVARALSGGGVIRYQAACTYCNRVTKEEISVPDELAKRGEKPADYPGYDLITLPTCKDEVAVRPLLIRDNKLIEARLGEPTNTASELALRIVLPVVSINGGRPDTVEEVLLWYNALPPLDASTLEQQETALTPKLETSIPHVCDGCGKTFRQTLLFNKEFFR